MSLFVPLKRTYIIYNINYNTIIGDEARPGRCIFRTIKKQVEQICFSLSALHGMLFLHPLLQKTWTWPAMWAKCKTQSTNVYTCILCNLKLYQEINSILLWSLRTIRKQTFLLLYVIHFQVHKISENGNRYVGIQVVDSDKYWLFQRKTTFIYTTVFRVKYSKSNVYSKYDYMLCIDEYI